MASDTVVMLTRLPKTLKKQLDREARVYKISRSELCRKKLQAIPLTNAPVVRLLEDRLPGGDKIIRVELPLSLLWKVGGSGKRRNPKRAGGKVADG